MEFTDYLSEIKSASGEIIGNSTTGIIVTIDRITGAVLDAAFALKFSAGQDQGGIEAEYTSSLFDIMELYVDSDQAITSFRNAFRRVANDAFNATALVGWTDAGNEAPISEDLQSWVNGEIETEISNIDSLFTDLRDLRKNGTADEQNAFIAAKAEGYAGALIGIYNYAKMQGKPEQEGEWVYGDTDHCATCDELNGQVHPLAWFADNGYIPQQRGSGTLECGGWRCQCVIRDPKTKEQLVP
jgi:hypothetical protein